MTHHGARPLTFAVIGVGGVGGYFGARLIQAGANTALIARGAHLRAVRERGLEVRSPLGDVRVRPDRISDDPGEVGPVDVILFAVKLYDADAAAAVLPPMIGDATVVVSLQNGVDAEDRLAGTLGRDHVMGGVAYIFAAIDGPGVIRHEGKVARIVFGELDGRRSARAQVLLGALQAAGIDAALSEDIVKEIWRKFVFIASLGAVASLARLPVGPIRGDRDARARFADAMEEVVTVAHAKGVQLDDGTVERHLAFADSLEAGMKPSLLLDLERGARLEIDSLSGTVARLGTELGVDVPVHRTAYGLLKLHADGTPSRRGGSRSRGR